MTSDSSATLPVDPAMKVVYECPFCGTTATKLAWLKPIGGVLGPHETNPDVPDSTRLIEGGECICGAWFYGGMPDV
jgi:hypothetical protein